MLRAAAMGCKQICMCCAAVPLSVIVLLAAIVVPFIMPKSYCQVGDDGVCKHSEPGKAVKCEAGVLVQITKQASLGLRHYPINGELSFATLTHAGCTIEYAATCGGEGVQVEEKWTCGQNKRAPIQHILGQTWQVCAKGEDLKLTAPVIDLTSETHTSAGVPVAGCIALSAPGSFPALDKVRGEPGSQKAALANAKAAAGGCPTWRTEAERVARGEDYLAEFNPLLAAILRNYMVYLKESVPEISKGLRTDTPEGPLYKVALFAGVGISGGGHHGMTVTMTTINCGMFMPSMLPTPGFSVTRHAEVGELIADPHQRRTRILGGAAKECCFDATLPVFMSTGSPEHNQVRKLWDTVGVATMHLGEIPEISPPAESAFTKIRGKAMSLAGIKFPFLDELGSVVAPIFLEKLWGRKPTAEEAATIAAYASVGGGCIMSHVLNKMPIVPGKVIKIREAALAFARDSPVGKAIGEEIQKPDYKELREVYGKRPKGVVDTAIGNLADASLFAGLIGTSTASMNCLAQVHRGPQFVKMFRANSTAFIFEVMRTATAVAGSQQVTRRPWKVTLWGEQLELPVNTLIAQMTGMAAGLDASVFPDPWKFNSSRENLGETMNWNGKTRYVIARDYANAPRFCPGALLSVKIASKVCHHYSAHLSEE